jgi:S1-C subfamily serine protease
LEGYVMKAFRIFAGAAVVGATVALMTSPLVAQQSTADKPSADVNRSGNQHAATPQQADEPTFFGVVIDPVHPIHPALAAQFQDLLDKNQGLVVERVAHDSPAAKAGIKQYDILASFADQKLFSTEQLLHLVHAETPGAKVVLPCCATARARTLK